jgi:hypothetical protein
MLDQPRLADAIAAEQHDAVALGDADLTGLEQHLAAGRGDRHVVER